MSYAKRTADGLAVLNTTTSLPDRSTPSNRLERRAIKRSLGIGVTLHDYAPVGTTEWAAALNEAIIDVGTLGSAAGDQVLTIPSGNYNLNTQITMAYPITIIGAGLGNSVLQPTHLGTGILVTGQYGTCPRIKDLTIGFTTGGANSTAHIIAQSYQDVGTPTINYSPDFLWFENLNLTGYNGSTASYNIVLDGNGRLNSVGGTVPIGLRSITLKDIIAFNATFRGLDLRHVRVATLNSTHIYGGAGVGGVATTGFNSSARNFDNKFFGCSINGAFSVSESDATELHGCTYGSLSIGAGVTNFVDV